MHTGTGGELIGEFDPPSAVETRSQARATVAVPFAIKLVIPPGVSATCDDFDSIVGRFQIRQGADLGKVIHALHAFKQRPALIARTVASEPILSTFSDLTSVLLDQRRAGEWYQGEFSVIRTRHGLRFITSTGGIRQDRPAQAHVDQIIALFAELGLPRTTPVRVSDGEAAIDDFLSECSANFRLAGEFEWSALARTRYFPTVDLWTNRFGETFSFDETACALVAKPLDRGSCGGTHGLFTLAVIAQINAANGILSREVADLTRDYLCATAKHVAQGQHADGSFGARWYCDIVKQPWRLRMVAKASGRLRAAAWLPPASAQACAGSMSTVDEEVQQVLMTGHHLEWMLLLPSNAQPAPKKIK
ncbi:MAG: hypothetical protein ACREJM_12180, partial [Candidatus Saccharimonadales bacterium]